MTFAWYGHLKYKHTQLWKVVVISWGIAFFEYCLQVPANRLGINKFNPFQLKIIQEVITLLVFIGFSALYLKQNPSWNHIASFGFILIAVYLGFMTGH